ncbi:hypothetical protein [Actinomadura sp. GTD37]|uniref:hypothetical protein n=1 Tax=Actinomadura sp. GTD37 TaxID=1778030 RepID=UPI0035BF1237
MSEDEHAGEQQVSITPRIVVNVEPPRPTAVLGAPGGIGVHPPMADSYRDARFHAWVDEVNARYLQRQYAARHINRA